MISTCSRILRSAIAIAVLGIVLAGGARPAVAAVSSVTLVNPGPGTYGEDDDYFTRAWGNPRDMEQAADLYLLRSTCNPTQVRRFTNESISDGMWRATTTAKSGDANAETRDVFVLNPGWGSSLDVGEDGEVHPVDAGHYTQLTFRLYAGSDPNEYGNIVFTKGEIGSRNGGVWFRVYPGWNIYTIDLKQRSSDWTGNVTGLWFSLWELPSGLDLKLDWVRLTPKQNRRIQWTGSGSGSVAVYLGDNLGDPNARGRLRVYEASHLAQDIQFGDSPLTVPASLPGGTYYAGVDDEGGIVPSSGAWSVRPVPIAQILAPSYASGEDWATTVAGNAWDMGGTDDVSGGDSQGVTYSASDGVVHITNIPDGLSGCASPWPHRPLALNLHGREIETSKYKYLSFRYKVDQAPDQGAGGVSRVRWLDNRVWAAGRTDDISLYNDRWIVYRLDLSTVPLEAEGARWTDLSYNTLQILANESHLAWTSHLDWVKLTAENVAVSSYVVGWEMVQGQATTTTLYWDADRNPDNGFASRAYGAAFVPADAPSGSYFVYLPLVARNLGAAEHSFMLSTEDLATGLRYYVALKLEDGYNTVYWYSELPVRKIS